jgi:hypothetical protein
VMRSYWPKVVAVGFCACRSEDLVSADRVGQGRTSNYGPEVFRLYRDGDIGIIRYTDSISEANLLFR